jgi:O-antigen ligase
VDAALALANPIAASSFGTGLEKAGVIVAALLAAVAVLARPSRTRALATAAALVLTPALLLIEVWDTPQLHPLRNHPLYTAIGAVAALVAVGLVAWLFTRHPRLFPVLAVAAMPFRLPIETGGQTANLLVPLYFVIGAGALAWLVPRLRRGFVDADARPRGRLEWALLGFVVLYAAQASYSLDFSKALDQVVFFYVPFALLFMQLCAVEWDRRLLAACFGVLVGLALVFAGIGFVEWATREVLFNPKVIRTNEFASYFRVNSLFFDPNIYGRFLAVTALLTTAVMLWSRRRRDVLLCAGALVVLLAALLTTLSQSSLAALLLGLVVLAALRWSVKWTLVVTVALAVVGAGVVLALPGVFKVNFSTKRLDRISTGRVTLVRGGAELSRDRPVAGWGSASFSKAFERQGKGSQAESVSASHTIPLTVAAEQGALGILVYLALLACALGRLFRGARDSLPRAAIAAAFAALLLHTFLYASFLEDPATWALLGVGTALAPVAARRMRPAERAQAAAQARARVPAI